MFEEKKIDQQKTICRMRRYMSEFSIYYHSIDYEQYMYNALHGGHHIREDDGLLNYLHYTSSVVQVPKLHQSSSKESKLITAMINQQKDEDMKKKRYLQVQRVLKAMDVLDEKQRLYLKEKYVYRKSNQQILQKYHIVESTLNRNLRKAYLHMAVLLQMEVYI